MTEKQIRERATVWIVAYVLYGDSFKEYIARYRRDGYAEIAREALERYRRRCE